MPPIHDYQCRACEKEYGVFYTSQSAVKLEEKHEKCPECGSKRKRKLVSKSTGISLKGNWFRQGY